MSKSQKIPVAIIILLLSYHSNSFALNSGKNKDILFSKSSVHLSDKDRAAIRKQMDFKLSKDKNNFVDELNIPITVTVKEVDLNSDGNPEVFVTTQGSTVTSGAVGSNIALFIKVKGTMRKEFEVPAAEYTVMTTKSKSYSDLCFGGPGEKFPVWRWNGNKFQFSHTTYNCN